MSKTAHERFIEDLEKKAKAAGRQLSEGAQRAKKRPKNYAELSVTEQWAIDSKLGILDWDGT